MRTLRGDFSGSFQCFHRCGHARGFAFFGTRAPDNALQKRQARGDARQRHIEPQTLREQSQRQNENRQQAEQRDQRAPQRRTRRDNAADTQREQHRHQPNRQWRRGIERGSRQQIVEREGVNHHLGHARAVRQQKLRRHGAIADADDNAASAPRREFLRISQRVLQR